MKKNVVIIAEAGVNHNGDMRQAEKLIDAAAAAGVDYVKFQTFKASKTVTKSASRASYQDTNTGDQDTQYDMLQKLELTEDMHHELIRYCSLRNIKFLSTGFDLESLEFLNNLNMDLFKIPSGEITNLPYLEKIASFGKPIVLSTGMATMEEVRAAYDILLSKGLSADQITVVHCNTEYPTPMEDVNLLAMLHIKKELQTAIGYSDHTLGIEVPIASVALGAAVIEKHFTLDRNLPGPDHRASLEPAELETMVTAIRNVEKAISGSGRKEPSPSEKKNKAIVRKSIVASKAIRKGEAFSEDNLTIKRPGTGISPMLWKKIIGTKAKRDIELDELL